MRALVAAASALAIALAAPAAHAGGDEGPASSVGELVARMTALVRADQAQSRALERVLADQHAAAAETLDALDALVSRPVYVPIASILPGQSRYSRRNVDDKVKAALDGGAAVDKHDGTYELAFDGGHAILPLASALPVVVGPQGLVLVDGHHDVLSSLALGATTVPVRRVGRMAELSVDEFWTKADADGLAYPHALGGAWQVPPRAFNELVDDPTRYFAAITARKCASTDQPVAQSTGAANPLWVKVGKDAPFIEFKIADALVAHGFEPGDGTATPEAIEAARGILRAHAIAGLRLIDSRLDALPPELCSLAPP